jgi:hypothetical protein
MGARRYQPATRLSTLAAARKARADASQTSPPTISTSSEAVTVTPVAHRTNPTMLNGRTAVT